MNMPAEQDREQTLETGVCWMKVSEILRRLATKATKDKEHRFTNLYDLLTYEPLMSWAFDVLMTNRGSRTAGIDGMDKRTAINNKDILLANLKAALKSKTYKHQPMRRVYIPKANGKRRPLGIPTLTDRLVQMMVKMILEPIFESDFLPESHGFRPQRSCHSAMAHIHLMTAPKQKKMYWTVEGDISGCFDHVQHDILIRLLKRRIQDAKLLGLIWQMLKAGVMEGSLFKKTDEGTPQGGVVSPLLANIYLHELDMWFHKHYTGLNYNEKNRRRKRKEGNAFYVRYADDFVVAWNGTKKGAERLKEELSAFLHDHLRLELSADKTCITHVTDGYDFLGFTIQREEDAGRGYNELVTYPSKKSVMKLKAKIKAMTQRATTLASVRDKMEALNYLLRGWANYFRHSAASRTLDYVGSYAFKRLEIWLGHKTGLRVRAVYRKYYRRHPTKGYLTMSADGVSLYHPGVEAEVAYPHYAHRPNPYLTPNAEMQSMLPAYHKDPLNTKGWDGTHRYGEGWTTTRAVVRKRDEWKCQLCGSKKGLEVHHIRKFKPDAHHDFNNLITLCGECHRKARNPQSEAYRQIVRIHLGTGKPDAVKVARPVWEGA
jgi:RNA-directed DNA polymerase